MTTPPRHLLLLLTLSAAALAAGQLPVPAPRAYCSVSVVRDYLLLVSYRAVLQLDPSCPPGGVARVRKASTLNRTGPYRPIKPNGSARYGGLWAWTLTPDRGNIPSAELWTSLSWEWEWWDGHAWRSAWRP